MALDIEPKDAFVGAMAFVLTLVPQYIAEEHHQLASGLVMAAFWIAWQGAKRLDERTRS